MLIKIERLDLSKINKARVNLQRSQMELEELYCSLEDKYHFCVQHAKVDLQNGTIHIEDESKILDTLPSNNDEKDKAVHV